MGILEQNSRLKTPEARLRRSLYLRWYSMIDRCCNPAAERYCDYGGNGVSVDPSWTVFENFLNDAKSLPGYDADRILEGGIHLDKDSRIRGNKVYSKDTCAFITAAENNKHIPSRMLLFIGTSPEGIEYESYNQTEFALTHNLRQSTIADCLSGRVVKHRGWTFRYKE